MTPTDAARRTDDRTTPHQVATFVLDHLHFGVEVRKVQEVIKYQELTRIPLAPPVVRGLINLRGQIVTAIELRRRLGLSERQAGELPMNVVVRSSAGVVSLLVDEIGDVVEASPTDFEPAPGTITGPARELITGVYKLAGRLLLALDVDRTVALGQEHAGE